LKLEGAEIGEEFSGMGRKDPSRVPADLLEEVFDLNLQLEEMRMARNMGQSDPVLEASLTEPKRNSMAWWKRWTATCASSGNCGMRATRSRAPPLKREWWQ